MDKKEMKLLRKFRYLILSILFLMPCIGVSQNITPKDSSNIKLINAAREIMTSSNNCALITLDEKGYPHARVMDPFVPEHDLTVWFGSNPQSKKVTQIKNNPQVALYYLDSDASGYVTIHGRAQLVDDKTEKEKRWKDEWKSFYPRWPDGYILIKVVPKWMEVISYTRGIAGDHITWQAPIVLFKSNYKLVD